mmetsp:Transcript_15840/g.23846  ORF Transcript_15840/g.23846 Transcript_15840/m.23846 type:complete len:131 (+) Transcript_15840:1351-1743(+)
MLCVWQDEYSLVWMKLTVPLEILDVMYSMSPLPKVDRLKVRTSNLAPPVRSSLTPFSTKHQILSNEYPIKLVHHLRIAIEVYLEWTKKMKTRMKYTLIRRIASISDIILSVEPLISGDYDIFIQNSYDAW